MSGSQLAVEYDSMVDRHDLYAKFGITGEVAQLFETDLGTLLLCLRALDNGWHELPDGDAARKVLDGINRNTLGQLLSGLKKHIQIQGDMENLFSSALDARNRLTHGFFEKHNYKIQTSEGRNEMIADLDDLHGELFNAWQSSTLLVNIITAAFRLLAQARTERA